MENGMTPEEIKKGETDRLEFKREVPRKDSRCLKTVVAFAERIPSGAIDGPVEMPSRE